MGNKGGKRRIEDRPAALPAQHHGLLAIVQTLLGHAPKVLESILMPADEGVEISVRRKVEVLPPGEGQDIGKALHLALAGSGERDRIGTPVHLSLMTWRC